MGLIHVENDDSTLQSDQPASSIIIEQDANSFRGKFATVKHEHDFHITVAVERLPVFYYSES